MVLMNYKQLPKDIVGETFENNAGQQFKVISKHGKKPNGNATYLIRFDDTDYERIVEKVEIKRGKIKDKLEKSVLGVGSLGDINMVNYKRHYNIWHKMIGRCYDPDNASYKSYGAKGVKVCEYWLCFANFVNDVPLIDGYDENLFNKGLLYLDKDIKQFKSDSKIYSIETCCFVDFDTNNEYRDNEHRKKVFYGLSPEGEIQEIKGIREFAKQNEMHRQSITSCLNKRTKTSYGWKFSYNKQSLIN